MRFLRPITVSIAFTSALACGNARDGAQLAWDDLVPIDTDGTRAVVLSPSLDGVRTIANSDVRPPRALALRDADGALSLPPAPAYTGALVDGGVAWVTVAGELMLVNVRDEVTVIARDVIPELTRRGALLAFATNPLAQSPGVYIIELKDGALVREPHRITEGLAYADRPLFVDDDTIVVVGARPSGYAGVWLASLAGAPPVAITNAQFTTGARTGAPAGFVPPPADYASMRVTAFADTRALVYFDGRDERVVELNVGANATTQNVEPNAGSNVTLNASAR